MSSRAGGTQTYTKDGVEASWAGDHPATWGSESSKITVKGPINAGAFSPDEALLAVGTGSKVYVYDVGTLELRDCLMGTTHDVRCVEWQPKREAGGYVLVSYASANYQEREPHIFIWTLDRYGRRTGVPDGGFANTTALARMAALEVGDILHSRYLWSREEAECKDIADGFATVLETAALKHNMVKTTILKGHFQAVSPNGKALFYMSPTKTFGRLRDEARYTDVWDMEARRHKLHLEGNLTVKSYHYNATDKAIVYSWLDRTVKMWDTESGELVKSLGPTEEPIQRADFSPDGKLLVIATPTSDFPSRTMGFWDVETGQLLHSLNVSFGTRLGGGRGPIAFSPDSKRIAMGGQSGGVKIIDVTTGILEQDAKLRIEDPIFASFLGVQDIHWIDEGRKIVYHAGNDRGIEVYDFEENHRWRFARPKGYQCVNGRAKESALWSASRRLLVSLDPDYSARFWHLR